MAFILLTFMASCAQNAQIKGPPYQVDLTPPVIQSARLDNEYRLTFEFDEAVRAVQGDVQIEPVLNIASAESEENRLVVTFSDAQKIGESYTMEVKVTDEADNALTFLYSFTGWNPRVPELLINEINPQGSGSTPDCIELFTLKEGNLGGLVLVIGTEGSPKDTFSFPAIEIKTGDYIVIHTQPDGEAVEIDEIGDDLSESGGKRATDTARDFWMKNDPGLPSNNGAVSLYNRKGGDIIDAVLWTNREDDLDDESLGWTSESFVWAEELGRMKAWQSAGAVPLPSEAMAVEDTTGTRTFCRASVPADTNSPADWHIVPTSGQTFGAVNIDDVYTP
ncbi:MAG: hypothetical protein B0D92_06605 [Spirochaeta sp. LUC14_002_19_P3]|nr:MAG: hypothetical protein B0D92_06605 [Spirochaeta sp. LUC14_002_19_P3]